MSFLDEIAQACDNSVETEKIVLTCIGEDYSNVEFYEALSKISHNFTQVSVNNGGTLVSLMNGGIITAKAETFVHVTVTCKNNATISISEYFGLQPLGGRYKSSSILSKRSDVNPYLEKRQSTDSGSFGYIYIEDTTDGATLAILQILNGKLLHASVFNQDGPVILLNEIEIGGQKITTDQVNPNFFISMPIETKYQPIVTSTSGGVEGCFENIAQKCSTTLYSELYVCAGKKSDTAFSEALKLLDYAFDKVYVELNDLQIPLISQGNISNGIISTAEHISTCSNYLQTWWEETFVLFGGIDLNTAGSAESLIFSSESSSRMVVEVSPTGVQATLIQVSNGQIQFVCMFASEHGQLQFADVPLGKVGGKDIELDQYSCDFFLLARSENSTVANTTEEYQDDDDDFGLLKTLLMSVYISIAAFYAYRSYKLHVSQEIKSLKSNINLAFFALFTIWASGNLIYLVAYFFKTQESSYYVKQILTLTYFATYLIFTMATHYRYHKATLTHSFRKIYSRLNEYPVSIDVVIIIANVVIHFGYLGITLMVEYCSMADSYSGNPGTDACSTILSSNVLVEWYTTMGDFLSFWGFIFGFIMGAVLVATVSRNRSIRRAHDGASIRYRNQAYRSFAVWVLLLVFVIVLAIIHGFYPGIYSSILIEIINTLQVYFTRSNDLVCSCI
jgi:hypothetical protein